MKLCQQGKVRDQEKVLHQKVVGMEQDVQGPKCWCSRGVQTPLSYTEFEFWVDLCKAWSWTRWSSVGPTWGILCFCDSMALTLIFMTFYSSS